eukprot:gene3643-4160_t
MDRRGLLCVFAMVLIYSTTICVSSDLRTRPKLCSNVNVSRRDCRQDVFTDAGNYGVKKATEQTKILSTQITPKKGSGIVHVARPKFVVNSGGSMLEGNENFELEKRTVLSRKQHNENSTVYEINNIHPREVLGFVDDFGNASNQNSSVGMNRSAELQFNSNQHVVSKFSTQSARASTVEMITPLQFTFGMAMNDRLRRNVFGKDDRLHIGNALSQHFPFTTVVRLGTGCTGTLIWYKHVLTSAHCIHDGNKFRPPLWKLKVGLLRRGGTFKWLGVKRAFVANAWIRKEGLGKIAHDYAVLELDKPHGRPYMTFGWHPAKRPRIIQFSGFPADKPVNEIWFSRCVVKKYTKKILYNYCDATPGMSGSGVYVYDKNMYASSRSGKKRKSYRKVVAIFSSFVQFRYKNGKIRRASNTATRLTLKKVERICNWIKAGKGCKLMR